MSQAKTGLEHAALPFKPEPLQSMRARMGAALKPIYDVEKLTPGRTPTKKRAHVFDFPQGVRIGLSRDRCGVKVLIHLSASVSSETVKGMMFVAGNERDTWKLANDLVRALTKDLLGFYLPEKRVVTEAGVLHWFFEEGDFNRERLRQ